VIADTDGPGREAFAREFDLCVVGSGPAGVTLARRAAANGLSVALLEAGGDVLTVESQEVYEGEVVGQDYFPLETTRLRFLGGSSNHWAGWSRPLEALDFEAKPWEPLSGWPISRADLDPYAAETDAILGLPAPATAPDRPWPDGGGDFTAIRFRYSVPTRNFGFDFLDEIAAFERIALGLNANLVDLRLDPDLGRVERAVFRGYGAGDPGFEVRARGFALACGGIETPRLLLNFASQAPAGIGNGHDLVGRYFAEHPHFVLADVILREPRRWPELSFFAPTPEFLDRHEALSFGLRLERTPWIPFALRPDTVAGTPDCDDFTLGEGERPADLISACQPGVDGLILFDGRLRIAHEQALNPESRVMLAETTDRFGLRRAALDWRMSPLDAHTQRVAILAFAGRMALADIGRARIRDWVLAEPMAWPGTLEDEVGGKHHIGSCRMAEDPRHGVVDRDCRVHGVANLWLAGSSVFSTGGHANPTYTIVQLALRLGDHVAARLAP